MLCFGLLLASKLYYFVDNNRFMLDQQGVLRLLTIPIYLMALYRAEYNIRRYRPFYDAESQHNMDTQELKLVQSEGCINGNDCNQGEFCFAEEEGAAYQWLWIELFAFVSQLAVVFILLL